MPKENENTNTTDDTKKGVASKVKDPTVKPTEKEAAEKKAKEEANKALKIVAKDLPEHVCIDGEDPIVLRRLVHRGIASYFSDKNNTCLGVRKIKAGLFSVSKNPNLNNKPLKKCTYKAWQEYNFPEE